MLYIQIKWLFSFKIIKIGSSSMFWNIKKSVKFQKKRAKKHKMNRSDLQIVFERSRSLKLTHVVFNFLAKFSKNSRQKNCGGCKKVKLHFFSMNSSIVIHSDVSEDFGKRIWVIFFFCCVYFNQGLKLMSQENTVLLGD